MQKFHPDNLFQGHQHTFIYFIIFIFLQSLSCGNEPLSHAAKQYTPSEEQNCPKKD